MAEIADEAWFAAWARLNPKLAKRVRALLVQNPFGGVSVRLPMVAGGQLRPELEVPSAPLGPASERNS